MKSFRLFIAATIFLILINSVVFAFGGGGGHQEKLLAFPGAQGYGAKARGAYGSSTLPKVILVSTFAELEAACEKNYPRVIICTTGGLWDSGTSAGEGIRIRYPYATIAGQTAPIDGDGMCITRGTLWVEAKEIIIRGLRIHNTIDYTDSGGSSSKRSCIMIQTGAMSGVRENIMIDHCDMFLAANKVFSIFCQTREVNDVTLSWNNISRAYEDTDSGTNAFAILANFGQTSTSDASTSTNTRISYHHNMVADCTGRTPLAPCCAVYYTPEIRSWNNVSFNGWRDLMTIINGGDLKFDSINDVFKDGSDTDVPNRDHFHQSLTWSLLTSDSDVHVSGTLCYDSSGSEVSVENDIVTVNANRVLFGEIDYDPHSAADAYGYVLDFAGAIVPTMSGMAKDIMAGCIAGTGNWITSANIATENFNAGTPTTDADSDGLPDAWEVANSYRIQGGLSSANATDSTQNRLMASYGSPYYAIEVYINELISDRVNLN